MLGPGLFDIFVRDMDSWIKGSLSKVFLGHSNVNSAIEEGEIISPSEGDCDLSHLLGDYLCHLVERQAEVTDLLI